MVLTRSEVPETLRPFAFHGVQLRLNGTPGQAGADCPFCGKDGKWYVAVDTTLWDCKVCGASGNGVTFLRQLHDHGAGGDGAVRALALDRGVSTDTLEAWGVRTSPLTGEVLLPAYTAKGELCQLYRYAADGTGRCKLWATPGSHHGLYGVLLMDRHCRTVYVCEGPWDAMALWEALRGHKLLGERVLPTANESSSMLAGCAVLATPAASVWHPSWNSVLAGKRVVLLFDNDHPRQHPVTRKRLEPPGWAGMRRVAQSLAAEGRGPESVHYLAWGKAGADHDASLPSGHDVRDHLRGVGPTGNRGLAAFGLLAMTCPVPQDWVEGVAVSSTPGGKGKGQTGCLPCASWRELRTAWQKAMKWIPGLDRALSVQLACILSTPMRGDQLWVRVIAPPSSGKSVLAEALSVARDYVFPTDTFTGLASGYQTDREGSENLSLVKKLKDKTLVINDGDTMLKLPNLGQVMSQLRAFYGRNLRTQYNNKMSANHEGINTTVILCGTNSLRDLDTSELGERFLTCSIMEQMDEDLEDEIGWRVVNRALADLGVTSDGTKTDGDSPEMLLAKRLTGGYVHHLRTAGLARALEVGQTVAHDARRRIQRLAEFVAYMRARPSSKQDESTERELSFRLIGQLARLAGCLAVVLDRPEVDAEVMQRVERVALDTARGRTLEICRNLHRVGPLLGADTAALVVWTGEAEPKLRDLLKFLRRIGAAEAFRFKPTRGGGTRTTVRWRLTARLRKLYHEVTGEVPERPDAVGEDGTGGPEE